MNTNEKAKIAEVLGLPAGTEAKRLRARLVGLGIRETCSRCSGGGRYSFNGSHSICYKCGGPGYVAQPFNARTLKAATEARDSGTLAAYLARQALKAEAKRQIKPLRAEIEAAVAPIWAAYDVAYKSGRALCRDLNAGQFPYRGESSPLMLLQEKANAAVFGSTTNKGVVTVLGCSQIESAILFGELDPEVGPFFAVEILKERLAEAEAAAAELPAVLAGPHAEWDRLYGDRQL